MNGYDKADWYDSVEVNDTDGELVGYALVRRSRACRVPDDFEITEVLEGDWRIITPVRSTRSTAWADLKDLTWRGGGR